MKHGQWMLNKEYGERWGACEYFDTKEEAIWTDVNKVDTKIDTI